MKKKVAVIFDVGSRIVKRSGKPFKSGKKVGVIEEVGLNPHTNLVAFRMDDGSWVDAKQCDLETSEVTFVSKESGVTKVDSPYCNMD